MDRLDHRAVEGLFEAPDPLFARPPGHALGNETAVAGPRLDDAVGLEDLISLRSRVAVDPEPGRQIPHGGKLIARPQRP